MKLRMPFPETMKLLDRAPPEQQQSLHWKAQRHSIAFLVKRMFGWGPPSVFGSTRYPPVGLDSRKPLPLGLGSKSIPHWYLGSKMALRSGPGSKIPPPFRLDPRRPLRRVLDSRWSLLLLLGSRKNVGHSS